ncbi:hypothetical protein ACHAXR_006969 [Thalassiosira sp. AJA248-18]
MDGPKRLKNMKDCRYCSRIPKHVNDGAWGPISCVQTKDEECDGDCSIALFWPPHHQPPPPDHNIIFKAQRLSRLSLLIPPSPTPSTHPTMAEEAAAVAGRQEPEQEELTFLPILNWIVFFFVMQNVVGSVMTKFMPPENTDVPKAPSSISSNNIVDGNDIAVDITDRKKGKPIGAATDNVWNNNAKLMKPACLWQQGTVMDLDVLITDSPNAPHGWPSLTTPIDDDLAKDTPSKKGGTILASWQQEELVLGGVSDGPAISGIMSFIKSNANQDMNHRNTTLTIPISRTIANNETRIYAFVKLQRRRHFKDGSDSRSKDSRKTVKKDDILVKRMTLTRYKKRKKMRDVKSLLDSSTEKDSSTVVDASDSSVLTAASLNKTHDQILLYMKPSLTLQIVELGPIDFPTKESIPAQFSDHMDFYETEGPKQNLYYPILYSSEFWITSGSLKEVNGTLKESKLDVMFEPTPMWKWQMQSQTEESWRKQEAFTGEEDQGNDMLRNMLLETNPWLLVITAVVSALHTVFDVLAFKNDISFFKKKKSMEGLSLRSMIVNAGFSLIILLYLADNETSYMILMSNGVGLAIELWKISKALTVSFEDGKIKWVEAKSYSKSKTKEYDETATSHLLFVTMPLVAGYGTYSLFYQKHKGWYSWILNTLVGFIYMFGFVMMTPQLFINYKLQSVAHLNWRTMSYKSINTFIDDLFAFVIKMPIMHRLACLRDDLIFFIYLFQRYKYRTDYTRVNEFGQCAQPTAEMLAEMEQEVASVADADQTGQPGNVTVRKRRGARDKKD